MATRVGACSARRTGIHLTPSGRLNCPRCGISTSAPTDVVSLLARKRPAIAESIAGRRVIRQGSGQVPTPGCHNIGFAVRDLDSTYDWNGTVFEDCTFWGPRLEVGELGGRIEIIGGTIPVGSALHFTQKSEDGIFELSVSGLSIEGDLTLGCRSSTIVKLENVTGSQGSNVSVTTVGSSIVTVESSKLGRLNVGAWSNVSGVSVDVRDSEVYALSAPGDTLRIDHCALGLLLINHGGGGVASVSSTTIDDRVWLQTATTHPSGTFSLSDDTPRAFLLQSRTPDIRLQLPHGSVLITRDDNLPDVTGAMVRHYAANSEGYGGSDYSDEDRAMLHAMGRQSGERLNPRNTSAWGHFVASGGLGTHPFDEGLLDEAILLYPNLLE